MVTNWEDENPPKKVFGAPMEETEEEWNKFMNLEGYSDQTKKLKSAGFLKFMRWEYGVKKQTKASVKTAAKKEKGKRKKTPKEGTESAARSESKPKRSRSRKPKESKEPEETTGGEAELSSTTYLNSTFLFLVL